MWFKLDDGFVTHPKILKAGPLALAVQVRAISYASHHKTDGYLPTEAIQLLLPDLGGSREEWIECMVHHRLWDRCDGGYVVHDYLDWNESRQALSVMKKQKSLAGKKGMKARWGKRSRRITSVITPVNNTLVLSPTDLSSLNSPNPKTNPKSKKHVNGAREIAPIPDDWTPKESHHKLARARGLELPIEAAHFRGKAIELEWHTKNWDQKFTNWMLQEVKYRQRRTP